MNLSDALASAPTQRPLNNACGVAVLLAQIAAKDGAAEAKKVNALLTDKERLATTLSQVLKANGYRINDATIRRHRRGHCSC